MLDLNSSRATAALPYRHDERATAGLRGQLRHRAAEQGLTPAWTTFEVTAPRGA